MSHTPGPWEVVSSGDNIGDDRELYFSVTGPPGDFFYLTNKADARLIAAAPDLYKALEKALFELDNCIQASIEDPDDSYDAHEKAVLDPIRAALAKARGEK